MNKIIKIAIAPIALSLSVLSLNLSAETSAPKANVPLAHHNGVKVGFGVGFGYHHRRGYYNGYRHRYCFWTSRWRWWVSHRRCLRVWRRHRPRCHFRYGRWVCKVCCHSRHRYRY